MKVTDDGPSKRPMRCDRDRSPEKLDLSDGLHTIIAQPGTEAEPALVRASPFLSVVRGMLRYVHW